MLGQLHPSDITLLRAFRSICESGGIAAAAERQNISASTLSTQLMQLENRLELKLCKRGRGGFAVLPQGEIVLKLAKKTFDEMQFFVHEVSKLNNSLVGELRIGIVDNTISNPHFDLSFNIRKFREQFPNVKIFVDTCPPEKLENAVVNRKYDLGIGAKHRQHAYLEYRSLLKEAQVICCGREHPFYKIPDCELKMEKLRDSEWVVDEYRFPSNFPVVTSPHQLTYVSSIEAGLHLILSGFYIGTLPTHFANNWIRKNKLRVLMESELSHQLEFFAFYNSNRKNTAIISRFWPILFQ